MNAIQQLMVAIISMVLGATSQHVFKQMNEQEQTILFWVSLGLLVCIFVWAGLKTQGKKKRALPAPRAWNTRKRKKGKRRPRGP